MYMDIDTWKKNRYRNKDTSRERHTELNVN